MWNSTSLPLILYTCQTLYRTCDNLYFVNTLPAVSHFSIRQVTTTQQQFQPIKMVQTYVPFHAIDRGCKSYLSTPHAQFFNAQVANATELNSNNVEDEDDMILDVNSNPTASTNPAIWAVSRNKNSAVIQHSSQYKPGDFRREIALDDEVNTWTSVDANPAYPERLLVRVKTYDDSWHPAAGDAVDRSKNIEFIIKVHIEYLTEFRELKYGLRYPVQRQPITVTINADNRTH